MTSTQIEAHDDLSLPVSRLMQTGKKRLLTQTEFLRLMSLLTCQRIISNGMEQAEFDETWPELQRVSSPSESFLSGLHAPKLLELRRLLARSGKNAAPKIL